MRLSFLGQSYDVDRSEIETPKTTTTARYRGKPYHPRRPLIVNGAAKPQLGVRRFRGVEY